MTVHDEATSTTTSPPAPPVPSTAPAAPAPPSATVRRTSQLLGGLVLYSVSIAVLVHSGLGNMPWDVLSQGVARQLGWTLGTATVVLSVVVLACWWPLRQRPGIGTVANVVVIGALVDPCLALLDLLPLAARIALVVGGIGLNALASGLYIGARLGPGPRDGLMTGIVARTGWPVGAVRGAIEGSVVVAGWLLGGTVGLGTLAYAVAIGPLIHLLLPRLTVPLPATSREPAAEPGEGR